MAEVTEAAVLAALRSVGDPDRDGNIVDLGMVSGLALKNGHVVFAIEVDRDRAARLEGLRRQAEKVVEAIAGVLSVSAVLTAERKAKGPAGRGRNRRSLRAGCSRPSPPSRACAPSWRWRAARAGSANPPPPSTSPSPSRASASRSACSTLTSMDPPSRA